MSYLNISFEFQWCSVIKKMPNNFCSCLDQQKKMKISTTKKKCMINEPHFYLKIKCNLSIFSRIKSFNGSISNDNPQWQTDHIWPRQQATWWRRVQRQSEEEAYFGLCAQTRGWGYLYLPIGAGEARWAAQFWWGPLTPKVEANSSRKSKQTMKISH